MTATEWQQAEKKTDPEFAGSLHERLGFSPELCPVCGGHLYKDPQGESICLNACHLGTAGKAAFDKLGFGQR